ncbi:MAG: hypothetical protein K9H25_22450 [Rhodospirillum sp.]|nr:hypothetical protein [Rhodospirillum sp.]MCF8491870.1 hypothetical protein [Rhodospirillum sp.]MCF8502510.1 hypothetical protein [Rhodospirillum sp.]
MIRRTRKVLAITSALILLSLVMGGLALVQFADDPMAMVLEKRERVVVPLPDSASRLVLIRRTILSESHRRHIVLERAGQPIVETELFEAADANDPLTVSWHEASVEFGGPYVRLDEPGGEILVDLVTPAVVRVLRTAVGPILTSPKGDARIGAVIGPDDGVTVTDGLAGQRLPTGTGRLLGTVMMDESGVWSFIPTAPPER